MLYFFNKAYSGYDEEEIGELTEQLEALTVTSEKLKALTLGRKFYGSKGGSKGGKSNSQDLSAKKQNTKCSVCGQFGHWHKDPQCPGPPKSKGGAPKGKAPSTWMNRGVAKSYKLYRTCYLFAKQISIKAKCLAKWLA